MLFVRFEGSIPVAVSDAFPSLEEHSLWQSRINWTSYEQVCHIARYLEALTRRKFLGVDEGSNVSPRFDIIELFSVGDPVSYAFNGDYYPDGYIVKITKAL